MSLALSSPRVACRQDIVLEGGAASAGPAKPGAAELNWHCSVDPGRRCVCLDGLCLYFPPAAGLCLLAGRDHL